MMRFFFKQPGMSIPCFWHAAFTSKLPIFICLAVLFFFVSCQKEGDFLERDAYYRLDMNWYYIYGQVNYHVVVDNKKIANLSNAGIQNIMVLDPDVDTPLKHLQIKLPATGAVLLDTTLVLRGNDILLTQWFEDSPLSFGAVPFTENAPDPADSSMCNYRFTYGDENMIPCDSVKLVFYSGNDVYRAYTLSAIDSVVVHKNEWTEWLPLAGNPKGYESPVWLFKLYDAGADTIIQDISYKTTGSNRGFTKAVGYTGFIEASGRPVYKFRRVVIQGGHNGSNGSFEFNNYEYGKFDVWW